MDEKHDDATSTEGHSNTPISQFSSAEEQATSGQVEQQVTSQEVSPSGEQGWDAFSSVFPTADAEDYQRWKRVGEDVTKLARFVDELELSDETESQIKSLFSKARHLLEFKRSYVLTVIGPSGTGKSTLINALLGRNLLVSAFGDAGTGTIISVHPLAAHETEEYAEVKFFSIDDLHKVVLTLEDIGVKLGDTSVKNDGLHVYFPNVQHLLAGITRFLDGENAVIPCPICHVGQVTEQGKCNNDSCQETIVSDLNLLKLHRQQLNTALDMLTAAVNDDKYLTGEYETLGQFSLSAKGLERLNEWCDENSDTNKNSALRIIPLIKEVEYHVAPRSDKHGLVRAVLTDAPGTGAITAIHDERLKAHLAADRTDAVILVVDPNRVTTGLSDVLPLVQKVTGTASYNVDETSNETATERIFVVVNWKTLEPPFSDATEKVEEGAKTLAKHIDKAFWQKQRDKNFFLNVQALPALMAEMFISAPDDVRQNWLNGQDTDYFGKLRSQLYIDARAKASK